jgi:hypothetical protein
LKTGEVRVAWWTVGEHRFWNSFSLTAQSYALVACWRHWEAFCWECKQPSGGTFTETILRVNWAAGSEPQECSEETVPPVLSKRQPLKMPSATRRAPDFVVFLIR